MKKEQKKLLQLIQSIEGDVLAVGITEPYLVEAFEKNEHIHKCYFLNSISNEQGETKRKKLRKNFSIRNLRKRFHKKKIDYMICNIEEILPYQKTFIKDSVYINKKKLYFYGSSKLELDQIWKRYTQYKAKVEHEKIGNTCFITISNEHSKTNKVKDICFSIKDILRTLYDTIGDLLIN